MDINGIDLENLSKKIVKKLFIEVEASGRHVHLSREDIDNLFGVGYKLTPVKDLSQPGQFVCKERVTLIGKKGNIENVVVLGPERKETQIEISKTDSVILGVDAPVRLSGDISNTPGITISVNGIKITKNSGLIVAKRHIHMTPKDASVFNLKDKQIVKLKVFGDRPIILEDTEVRIREDFATFAHIDYDEANACGFKKGTLGIILK